MTSPVCVDASLVMRLLVPDPLSRAATALWRSWADDGRELVAPALLCYEIANALHRMTRQQLLRPDTAQETLEAALALPITLVEAPELLVRAFTLARSLALPTAYDAHYLAVAESRQCELWTADARLVRAVGSTMPWVRLLT
jgi:predicted nucleic acid-binding protein